MQFKYGETRKRVGNTVSLCEIEARELKNEPPKVT